MFLTIPETETMVERQIGSIKKQTKDYAEQGSVMLRLLLWKTFERPAADAADIYIMMQCLSVTKNEHFLKRSV